MPLKPSTATKMCIRDSDNPEYFYNILPYAYVLGVSDKWMKKFEGITMEAPHWYYSCLLYTSNFKNAVLQQSRRKFILVYRKCYIRICFHGISTVSYTHLDVYKRQPEMHTAVKM